MLKNITGEERLNVFCMLNVEDILEITIPEVEVTNELSRKPRRK
jgi:hypothetical protein